MATTTPDSLYYPVGTDAVAPLHTVLANMQTSVQTAMSKRQRTSYVWANDAARNAQTGMVAGSTGYQLDTKTEYVYNGTVWALGTSYAEFTGSKTVPNNAYTAVDTLTLNSGNTTDSTFATLQGQVLTFVNPGIYALSLTASYNTTGGTSFTVITPDLARSSFVSITGHVAGVGTVSVPLYRAATAGTQLYLWTYNTPGATSTANFTLRVGRVA